MSLARKFSPGQEVTVKKASQEKYKDYGEKMNVEFYKNGYGLLTGSVVVKPVPTSSVRCSWLDKDDLLHEKFFNEDDLELVQKKK